MRGSAEMLQHLMNESNNKNITLHILAASARICIKTNMIIHKYDYIQALWICLINSLLVKEKAHTHLTSEKLEVWGNCMYFAQHNNILISK